jgi:hypothetical protein
VILVFIMFFIDFIFFFEMNIHIMAMHTTLRQQHCNVLRLKTLYPVGDMNLFTDKVIFY